MKKTPFRTKEVMKNLLLLFIAIILFSCGDGRKLPKQGEKCYITEKCLSAKDGYFDELNNVCNRKDEAKLSEMISEGNVVVLETYYDFTMLEYSFLKCKVRATDFSGDKYEVWISSEFIKEKK